ncbi:MAG: alpha/beta fold hydrolase [Candidatus Woesearchaeota archaeon]
MRLFWVLIVVFVVIMINGCGPNQKSDTGGGENMIHEDVSFETEDGVKIVGDLYKGGEKWIILLHMYTVTKKSWEDFAEELQEKGYSVLAIDFRGHGESDLEYDDFNEQDFNNMLLDAKGAKDFLGKSKNVVMGASIGANIAIKFANDVDGAVALSPAFNYKGISTRDDASGVSKPVLIVVSDEDTQSVGDSRELNGLISGSKLEVYSGKGHGTNMLDRETKDMVLSWLDENF